MKISKGFGELGVGPETLPWKPEICAVIGVQDDEHTSCMYLTRPETEALRNKLNELLEEKADET